MKKVLLLGTLVLSGCGTAGKGGNFVDVLSAVSPILSHVPGGGRVVSAISAVQSVKRLSEGKGNALSVASLVGGYVPGVGGVMNTPGMRVLRDGVQVASNLKALERRSDMRNESRVDPSIVDDIKFDTESTYETSSRGDSNFSIDSDGMIQVRGKATNTEQILIDAHNKLEKIDEGRGKKYIITFFDDMTKSLGKNTSYWYNQNPIFVAIARKYKSDARVSSKQLSISNQPNKVSSADVEGKIVSRRGICRTGIKTEVRTGNRWKSVCVNGVTTWARYYGNSPSGSVMDAEDLKDVNVSNRSDVSKVEERSSRTVSNRTGSGTLSNPKRVELPDGTIMYMAGAKGMHRYNGPAFIQLNGTKQWYTEGVLTKSYSPVTGWGYFNKGQLVKIVGLDGKVQTL